MGIRFVLPVIENIAALVLEQSSMKSNPIRNVMYLVEDKILCSSFTQFFLTARKN